MTERFELSLKTGNAAFEDQPASEIARIIKDAAERIENGEFEGNLYDINGNRVGCFFVKGKR